MQAALAFMDAHGRGMKRERGGFWIGLDEDTHGSVWFTWHTIDALTTRGLVEIVQWHGQESKFAVEIRRVTT
jgi:hypothetical protein